MIEIKQVSKLYEGKEAIKDVTLVIHEGSIFGLLGSNGKYFHPLLLDSHLQLGTQNGLFWI